MLTMEVPNMQTKWHYKKPKKQFFEMQLITQFIGEYRKPKQFDHYFFRV